MKSMMHDAAAFLTICAVATISATALQTSEESFGRYFAAAPVMNEFSITATRDRPADEMLAEIE
jgi:hypothetical protein